MFEPQAGRGVLAFPLLLSRSEPSTRFDADPISRWSAPLVQWCVWPPGTDDEAVDIDCGWGCGRARGGRSRDAGRPGGHERPAARSVRRAARTSAIASTMPTS